MNTHSHTLWKHYSNSNYCRSQIGYHTVHDLYPENLWIVYVQDNKVNHTTKGNQDAGVIGYVMEHIMSLMMTNRHCCTEEVKEEWRIGSMDCIYHAACIVLNYP